MIFSRRNAKLLILLNSLLLVIVSILLLYAVLNPYNIEKPIEDFVDARFFSVAKLSIFLLALLILVLQFFVIRLQFQKDDKPAETVSLQTSNGNINISILSLETLARSAIDKVKQISDIRIQTNIDHENIQMDVYVKVAPTVLIPKITAQMQSMIVDNIYISTGIELHSVRVFVDGVAEIS